MKSLTSILVDPPRKRRSAKRGKKFVFHGAYGTKAAAVRHEKKGEFIRKAKIRGSERFLLLEPIKKRR